MSIMSNKNDYGDKTYNFVSVKARKIKLCEVVWTPLNLLTNCMVIDGYTKDPKFGLQNTQYSLCSASSDPIQLFPLLTFKNKSRD